MQTLTLRGFLWFVVGLMFGGYVDIVNAVPYDAGFLGDGSIYICGYAGTDCTAVDNGGTSPAPVNSGVGFIKITNPANPLGVSINVGAACPQVPPGWTAGNPCVNGPLPPSTAASQLLYNCGGQYPTNGACIGYQTSPASADTVGTTICSAAGGTLDHIVGSQPFCLFGQNVTGLGNMGSVNACPVGYVNNSGACVLSTPSAVPYPEPQNCEVSRSGNTFSFDSRNPGCSTASGADTPAKAVNLAVDGGSITLSGGGKGVTITIGADGKAVVEISQVGTTGLDTMKKKVALGVPGTTGLESAGGKVEGVSVETVAGIGTLMGTGGAGGGGSSCGGSGQPSCAVTVNEGGTTDSGGAGAAAQSLVDRLTELKNAADASTASGNMNAFGVPTYQATTTDSQALVLPLTGSDACDNPSVTMFGQTVPMAICSVTQPFKSVLSWFFATLVGLYAWYRFSGRTMMA